MAATDVPHTPHTKNHSRTPMSERLRDNLTGWLFIAPAMILISIFGLFPILFATYMSLHRWLLVKGNFLCESSGSFVLADCFSNYTNVVGDWGGAALFVMGLFILVGAYWLWAGNKEYFAKPLLKLPPRAMISRLILPVLLIISAYFFITSAQNRLAIVDIPLVEQRLSSRLSDDAVAAWQGSIQSQLVYDNLRSCDSANTGTEAILACLNEKVQQSKQATYLQFAYAPMSLALAIYLLFLIDRTGVAKIERLQNWKDFLARFIPAILIMGIGVFFVALGYGFMIDALPSNNEAFVSGLTITLYYALASVPFQLGLGLVLAYVLYQNIRGKQFFRMIFFMPYVTPVVASAVVFKLIFRPAAGLANNIATTIGFDAQKWLNEPAPFLNAMFGLNLEGFWAGPSMALMSIVLFGIWSYAGYNAIIFLAGLGQIPGDLYEAAEVDGANDFDLFRYITLPLLSPVTFYLSVLAFIGTFKAFNHIFVMKTPLAQGTVDTASLVIYSTFKEQTQYGLATAQAILLFIIILGLTQVQRTFFEKKVFYG